MSPAADPFAESLWLVIIASLGARVDLASHGAGGALLWVVSVVVGWGMLGFASSACVAWLQGSAQEAKAGKLLERQHARAELADKAAALLQVRSRVKFSRKA